MLKNGWLNLTPKTRDMRWGGRLSTGWSNDRPNLMWRREGGRILSTGRLNSLQKVMCVRRVGSGGISLVEYSRERR